MLILIFKKNSEMLKGKYRTIGDGKLKVEGMNYAIIMAFKSLGTNSLERKKIHVIVLVVFTSKPQSIWVGYRDHVSEIHCPNTDYSRVDIFKNTGTIRNLFYPICRYTIMKVCLTFKSPIYSNKIKSRLDVERRVLW
jgi:hypothetical protein